MLSLRALRTVLLYGFMKVMVCLSGALLAVVICADSRQSGKHERSSENYGTLVVRGLLAVNPNIGRTRRSVP